MLWKTIGSCCVYQSASGIRIFDNYFYRSLKLESEAFQTVLNKFHPEKPCLPYIKTLITMACLFPGNCALLGLGGAAAAHALSPHMPDFTLTAVEINGEIIETSGRYFMSKKIPNLRIIQDEAYHFLCEKSEPFKHILVDLFDAHSFPRNCSQELFFKNCKDLLVADGVLAINVANRREQRPIYELIKKQFLSATITIPIKNCANVVILAFKASPVRAVLKELEHYQVLRSLTWDSQWGYVAKLREAL